MSLKERFDNLPPARKKVVVWALIGAAFIFITAVSYNASSRSDGPVTPSSAGKTREITLEPDMIQKTMLREQRREMEAMREELAWLRNEQERQAAIPPPEPKTTLTPPEEERISIPSADDLLEQDNQRRAERMPPGNRFPMPPGAGSSPPPPPEPVETITIGGIGVLSNENIPAPAAKQEDKKKARKVYLPPSFMEARLLTGFDASTSGEGASNPEPLLLRIQTPAVLPNDIKANLRGCFILAEAVGRLHKERADVRLVSLSCLSAGGDAVIDTPIKGFVTDSDSKVGLSGKVVSRMGAATARAVMAGIFGGGGDALQAASRSQSISPLGSTSMVQSDQLARSAVGGGLSEGTKTLKDFYLDLAKQATPVIEIGAAKKITVVISEGRELEIREFNSDERL